MTHQELASSSGVGVTSNVSSWQIPADGQAGDIAHRIAARFAARDADGRETAH
jgi:hypothetical protein